MKSIQRAYVWLPILALATLLSVFLLDKPAALWAASLPREYLPMWKAFSFLADPSINLTILPVFFLIFRKEKPLLWMVAKLLIAISLANIAVSVLKVGFGRARPDLFIDYGIFGFYFFQLGADYLSFPSAHAACCGALWGGLFYAMQRQKFFFLTLGILLASTRVFLNMHFVSDVIAGFTIGLASSYIIVRKSPGLWQNFKEFLWTHT